MALNPTRGSAVVLPSLSAALTGNVGGNSQSEFDLASFPGIKLWLDGKSLIDGSALDLIGRIDNYRASLQNGVLLTGDGGPKDNLAFLFDGAVDTHQRIYLPTYTLSPSYTIAMVINAANVTTAASVRALAFENPTGEYLSGYLEQPSANSALTLRWRHGSAGGINQTGAVPHSTRGLLLVDYEATRMRLASFWNKTLIATAVEGAAKAQSTGLWLGGRPGNANAQHKFAGNIEAIFELGGGFYSPDANSPNHLRRNNFIDLVAAAFGLTI